MGTVREAKWTLKQVQGDGIGLELTTVATEAQDLSLRSQFAQNLAVFFAHCLGGSGVDFPSTGPISKLGKLVILVPTLVVKRLPIRMAATAIHIVRNHILKSFSPQTHNKRMKKSLDLMWAKFMCGNLECFNRDMFSPNADLPRRSF